MSYEALRSIKFCLYFHFWSAVGQKASFGGELCSVWGKWGRLMGGCRAAAIWHLVVSPLLLLGAPGEDESSWFSALKPGDGEACRVSHALAPPLSNRPSPALAPSVGLNNPEAARLCVGGRSKTQPLPLATPHGQGAKRAVRGWPRENKYSSLLLAETWCVAGRKLRSPSGGLGTGIDINLVVNWDSIRTDGFKD